MHSDDPDALEHLLEFLYTGDYSYTFYGQSSANLNPMPNVQKQTEVYKLAEKYDVGKLKQLAEKRIKESARWISPAASMHGE